jgi:hypothetical protein
MIGRAVTAPISRVIIVAIVALLATSVAHAQQPDPRAVMPERPTVATHAGTVATGYLEIETGAERDQFDPGAISYFAPTVFKIGVATRGQLSIGVPIMRPSPGNAGLGDANVGLKWRFVDDAPIVGDFALLPSVKFSSGSESKGTGSGTTDVSVLAISSHKLGEIAVDINVGYTRRGGDGSTVPKNATQWTFSTGGPFSGAFGWVAECYGYPHTDGPAGQASIVAVLAGPTFLARPWLAFDAGVIIPVRGPQPHALYAGGVYNVGRIWTAHP